MYNVYNWYNCISIKMSEKNDTERTEQEQEQHQQQQQQQQHQHQQQQQRSDILKEKVEIRRKQQIHFIMTQTNYDENEASEKLKIYNNDVMKVIGEYLGISPKEDTIAKKTKNQKIYTVIRDIMDKGSRNYQMQQDKKQQVEKIKKWIENKNDENKNETTSKITDVKICKEKLD